MAAQRSTTASRDDLAEERRTAILIVAERLIAIHGFDALRLRDVAQEAGVSIGLLQHYFGTRDEMLFETMRLASHHRAEQWRALADRAEGVDEKLTALLEGSIADQHRCIVWLETCAAATRHAALRPDVELTQKAWQDALRLVVDEGVRQGEFAPTIATADIVVLLVSLIDGLMLATANETDDAAGHGYRNRLLNETADRLLKPAIG